MASLRERYPYTRDSDIFPPLKPEVAQAIGYVAVHWSLVEEQLGTIIRFLLGCPHTVELALLAEVPTLTRLTMIRALVLVSQEAELLAEWGVLENEIDGLRAKRNDAVHAVWRQVAPTPYAKRVKAKSKFRYELGPVEPSVIAKLADEILDMSDKLVSFTSGIIFSDATKRLSDHALRLGPEHIHVPALVRSAQTLARAPAPKRTRKLSKAQRRKAALGQPSGS